VSFTRSKGVYGGVNLDGTVVHANTKFNGEFFGAKKEVLPPDVVMRHASKRPAPRRCRTPSPRSPASRRADSGGHQPAGLGKLT